MEQRKLFSLLVAGMVAAGSYAAPAIAAQEKANGAAGSKRNAWASRCFSSGRTKTPNCFVRQKIFLKNGGAMLASVKIRLSADAEQPTMIVSGPLGVYLPAGVKYDIDGGKTAALDLETCDKGGCYSVTPVSDALLKTMRAGKQLNLHFENLKHKDFSIPVTLAGFTRSYDRIR